MNTAGRIPPFFGMRKLKSIMAVFLSFLIWQGIRIFLPQLDVNPGFAYIYAIVEMRDSAEKTRLFGWRRIKATLLGLAVGLLLVRLSVELYYIYQVQWQRNLVDLCLIMAGSFVALYCAQIIKCENMCGIAAIIVVICLVWHSDTNRYLYATLRVFQTLLGVFSAAVINSVVCRYPKKLQSVQENCGNTETKDSR